MMNIIGASSLRQVDNSEFLYIGNMADVITNETQLATRLGGVDASDITQFQIIGNDIKCKVSKVFSVLDFENSNVSFFVSKFSSLQSDFTGFTGASKLKSFAHYNSGNAVKDENFEGSGVKHLFFPNAKICAGYGSLGRLTDTKIYMPSVDTFNRIVGGANSIVAGSSNLTIYKDPNVSYPFVVDNFVDILDTTTPNSVTDLSPVEIGGTYVKLNFTEIANADFYELWFYDSGLDTFLFKGEVSNNSYVTRLKENTNYQIKIATCDQYWNGSGFFEDENKRAFSNTINVTTTTIDTTALFQNAVAYYKLDETSGNAVDVINGFNGALFGGVTQGVAGKIGTAYSFDGSSGFINYGNNAASEFSDGLENDIPFTIRMWINPNNINAIQALFHKDNTDNNNREFSWFLRDGGDFTMFAVSGVTSQPLLNMRFNAQIILNQYNHVVLTYDGSKSSGGFKIYVNGVQKNQTTSTTQTFNGFINGNSDLVFGREKENQFYYNGIADEQTIIKEEVWDIGKILDDYNNGNGTTI